MRTNLPLSPFFSLSSLVTVLICCNYAVFSSASPQDSDPQVKSQDDENSNPPVQQMGEMELMERVEVLRVKLEAQVISDRDAAEKELKSLGPMVLDFLDIPDDDVSSEAKERILRIRQALEKLAAEAVTKPSRLSLKGTMTLGEVFASIKKQTRNDVGLIDQSPPEFLNQPLVLNLNDVEFWSAMEQVMEQAKLVVAPYNSDRGQLRLAPQQMMEREQPDAPPAKKIEIPNDQAGVFSIRVSRIDASRNLLSPANSHCNINLQVRWEPRIQPISVVFAMKDVAILNEFDEPLKVSNPEAVSSGTVQPQIPELDFVIPIQLVDRQVEVIKSLSGKINAVLPGRIETFKFENLGDLEVGAEQSKAGVIVDYGGARKNDDIWSVLVNVGFDESNEATESYQGWVYENEVYLLDENNNRHDFIGYESFSTDQSKIGVQYLFDLDPAKCTLIYKTPAAIVKTPIVFKLEKIPLP